MIPKEICKDYIIEYKNLIINLRCRLVMVSGHLVTLYPKEFAMLCLLANYPGWVFTKEQIYEEVYSDILPIYVDNTIYCLVYSLRNKLEANSKYIQTVRGVGYKFVIPEE